jgi:hypothetical protein
MEINMSAYENSRPGDIMFVSHFARWAGIGRKTARHEIRSGRIRAIKAGARTFVTLEDARLSAVGADADRSIFFGSEHSCNRTTNKSSNR